MKGSSIGLMELSSIAAGFSVADTMLKAGDVRLLLSRSICSGKFMVLIGGEPAAVGSAVAAGIASADGFLIDHVELANLHPEVLAAIGRTPADPPEGAMGVVESFNVAALIAAADAAVKSSNVVLRELRLAMALGGKAFALVTGDVASVESAVAAAKRVLCEAGVLVNAVVLARPHPEVWREIV
ncbi:MAG: BMC domain-containing protein [Verrucomicrobiales bacterium]|nr:BMC domain-containing protein [Verrucomicrobiales bacterium]